MTLNELKHFIGKREATAAIISYADSNHYLAGAEDANGNFYSAADGNGQTMVFNSLVQAESFLAQLGASEAVIHMQSAYDEMVGSQGPSDIKYPVYLAPH
jgi:hypothetical protein